MTCSLAIAEACLQFEHRDLHWGNVLVKDTDQKVLDYGLAGSDIQIDSYGVKVSIIDFTLSRLDKGRDIETLELRPPTAKSKVVF